MVKHIEIIDAVLRSKIKHDEIHFAGNTRLKIYGLLNCSSGKRMKKVNRVFFTSQQEAIAEGYRPCGHCMKKDYLMWKYEFVQ